MFFEFIYILKSKFSLSQTLTTATSVSLPLPCNALIIMHYHSEISQVLNLPLTALSSPPVFIESVLCKRRFLFQLRLWPIPITSSLVCLLNFHIDIHKLSPMLHSSALAEFLLNIKKTTGIFLKNVVFSLKISVWNSSLPSCHRSR